MTRAWHSLHRRRVTVTGGARRGVSVLDDAPDVGFLQLSALNRAPGDDDQRLLPARGRRRLGRLEPVRAAARADDRARRAARARRRHRGGRRHPARRADRRRAHDRPGSSRGRCRGCGTARRTASGCWPWTWPATRSRRCRRGGGRRIAPGEPGGRALPAQHLDRAARRRTCSGTAPASRATLRAGRSIEHLRAEPGGPPRDCPTSCCPATRASTRRCENLVAQAVGAEPVEAAPAAARAFDDVAAASRDPRRVAETLRVRPQLRIDADAFAGLAAQRRPRCCPTRLRLPARSVVTTPRPYLRWEPVPAPALVARHELGTGEQPAAPGGAQRPGCRPDTGPAERHLAPPKATQLEAETAGLFDAAIGTGDAAEIRRLYAIALAERGTLLDQFVPSLTDATRDRRAARHRAGRPARRRHRLGAPRDAGRDHGRARPTHRRGPVRRPRHRRAAAALPARPLRDRRLAGVLRGGRPARAARAARAAGGHRAVSRARGRRCSRCASSSSAGTTLGAHVVGHEVRVSLPPGRAGARRGVEHRRRRARSTSSGCGARTWRASPTPPTAPRPTRSSPRLP